MDTTKFLMQVLPDEGEYCIVGLKAGQNPQTYFYDNINNAVTKAHKLDEDNFNSYFACASFEDPAVGRKTINVQVLKSFYLDIDCGSAKEYPDQAAGLEAFAVFLDKTGLPTPTIVSSGYGLHVYWALKFSIRLSEWKPVAERLKTLCKEHALHADASVTADAARILRVPGTSNYKRDPAVPVEVLFEGEEASIDEIRQVVGVTILLSEPPDYLKAGPSPLMQSLSDDKQKRFALILDRSTRGDGCQQLVHIATNQEGLDYNLWRAGLSIARNCTDFEIGIHAISDKHLNYDFETTIRKSEDLIDKPYKCETIESFNPGGCKRCPHKGKIKSPIVLGIEIQGSDEEVIVEIEDGGEAVEYEIPVLPIPYFRAKSGAIYIQNNDESEMVYEHSLYLIKRMTDSIRGDLALARLHLPREKAREFVIPLSAMTSKDELRKVLSANGVLSAGDALSRLMWYLICSAKQQQVMLDTEVLHNQMGWAEGDTKFILGTNEVGVSETRYSPPSEITESVSTLLYSSGTLDNWKRVVEPYSRPGAEAFAFAFFTAFGAPLMKFSGYNGALISLVNAQSGTGKTTIMRMVNSVYGHPSKLLSTEGDTYAHKIHRLGVLNNLPYTMDELTNIQPEVASKLAYAVSQGQGPGRMQSQSNMERKNTTTWATIALATSNSSIADKISSGKATANGELMRLIEYKIDSLNNMSKSDAYQLFEVMLADNFGVAGPLYIDYVVKSRDDIKRQIITMQEHIDKRARLVSKERYWAATIAANLVGGTVSHSLDLHGISPKPVLDWVIDGLIPSLRRDMNDAVPDSTDILGEFLNANQDSILVINAAMDRRSVLTPMAIVAPRRQLLVRVEPDMKRIFIGTKPFKDFCMERQVSSKDLLKDFRDRGAYLGETKKRMGKGTNSDSPAVRVHEFTFEKEDFFGIEGMLPNFG